MKTDKEMPNMVEIESNLMADATGLEWRGPYCLQLMLERLPDLKKKKDEEARAISHHLSLNQRPRDSEIWAAGSLEQWRTLDTYQSPDTTPDYVTQNI